MINLIASEYVFSMLLNLLSNEEMVKLIANNVNKGKITI